MKQQRGTISLDVMVGVVLAALFLFIVIALYKPVTSPQFHLGMKEQICRSTIILSQTPLKITPICSTPIISFSEKKIMQGAKKGETVKDAAMHQILNYMLRCKTMVNGPKRTGFLSENSCYICYSLHTDKTTPRVTEDDLVSYSFNHKSSTGKSYFFELNSDNHWPTTFLNGGLGVQKNELVNDRALSLGKDYGITYVSANKGSFWETVGIVGAGAGGCALAGATWFIPYAGPVIATVVVPTVCKYSLGAAGGVALFNIFKPSEAEGTILFTNYEYLNNHGCGDNVNVIS